jgi:hypothetical protein
MATFLRSRATLGLAGMATPALLTYYWDSAGATPAALATEAHARVRAFWNNLAPAVGASSTLTIFPEVDEIEETNGAIVGQTVGTLPPAVTFSAAGDFLPYQTQALLRLTTGTFIDGRRLRGRQYLPGWTELSNTSGGVPAGSSVANITSAAALLGTTIVTPMNQRVWHRPKAGSPGLSAIVVARQAGVNWAVLKSRRT